MPIDPLGQSTPMALLVAHPMLVHDAAARLIAPLTVGWPDLADGRCAVLRGPAARNLGEAGSLVSNA